MLQDHVDLLTGHILETLKESPAGDLKWLTNYSLEGTLICVEVFSTGTVLKTMKVSNRVSKLAIGMEFSTELWKSADHHLIISHSLLTGISYVLGVDYG